MHLRADPHSTTTSTATSVPISASPLPIALDFAQKAFIVDADRLLLVRKSVGDPHHPGRWEVPGGRLDVGSDIDLDDHIRREVWEEVGIKVDPGPPFHLWEWYLPGGSRRARSRVVAVARVCRPLSAEITMDNQVAGDHLAEALWVPCDRLGAFDEQLIPDLRPAMRHFLAMRSAADQAVAAVR